MAISVPAKRRWRSRADPAEQTRVRDAISTTSRSVIDAATVTRAVVAACAFGAAAIHFGFAPDHFGQSRFHGAFFFLVGWAQLAFGLAVIVRPTRFVMRLGILLNVGIILVWVVSRLVGMPFGGSPWVPEPVAFPDVLATVLEVGAVVGSYLLLTGRVGARSYPLRFAAVGGVALALALVGVTTASVAPALAGSHTHAVAGHVHAATGVSVAHVHGADVTNASTGSSGTSGDAGHTHGAAGATGIETATGSSPCEQAGVNIEGSGHGSGGPVAQQAITDPATRTLLSEQLAAARAAAMQYPTAADAMAAGYRRVTVYLPCIGAHYINPRLVDTKFDPANPEMLLYDGNGPDARIVGLSYYVRGTTVPPEGFAGPNDQWHQHIGLCVNGSGVIGGTTLTADQCAELGGIKADGSTAFMVHAWVVPGWESAWGTFSSEHPELGRTVAH